jgi:hypothetical protein
MAMLKGRRILLKGIAGTGVIIIGIGGYERKKAESEMNES